MMIKIRNYLMIKDVIIKLKSWSSAAMRKERNILFERNDD